jgi:3-dehydroquinate dehydratase/shikimate dehydrogenase
MCTQDPDVVKVAVSAQQPQDNVRVLGLLHAPAKPTVALCMSDMGMASRVLAARYGAPFTYGAFNKERGIAPGLLSYDELRHVYHYERVSPATAVYGVVGDPVGHSLSPLIHNKAMHKLGIDGVYLPFRVPRGDLPAVLKSFESFPVNGYSVTIPHKEAAAALATFRDESVQRMQAANTLVRTSDGWSAYNTDAEAALEALQENLPTNPDGTPTVPLHSRSALILGAGGVARALAYALGPRVGQLTISNRTGERAHKLAEEVGCRAVEWGSRHSVMADLLINCTSVGMYPDMDESPVHHSFLKEGLMVFDTVYTPENTLLIKEARERDCHVLTGVEMFVRQAALQFRLFTGKPAPLDLFRTLVKRALSPVALRDEE